MRAQPQQNRIRNEGTEEIAVAAVCCDVDERE